VPSVSAKQKKFMDASAHNPAFAKASGVPVKVAKEFSEKSKGMKFGKDADTSRADLQKINKPKTLHGKMSVMKGGGMAESKAMVKKEVSFMKKAGAPKSMVKHEESEMKKMAKGGSAGNGITTAKMGAVKSGGNKGKGEHAIQSKGLSKGTMVTMKGSKPLGMKKGGKAMAYGGKAC
jgi:hypothetical protein